MIGQNWPAFIISLCIGVASGIVSARVSIAVMQNDISWIKSQISAIWKRLDKLESEIK